MSQNNRGRSAITIILILTFFILGFVIGMIVLHFTYLNRVSSEIKKVPTVQIEEKKEPDIKIYVPERKRVLGAIPINPYNLENFKLEEGYMAYYDESGTKISHLGVDLSYHQQSVDWDMLKDSECEFVILRCGYRGYSEGGIIEDEKFAEYAKAANEKDIPLGVYFFSQAITVEEAVEEADFVLEKIADYKISYPVVFDTEYVSDSKARTNTAGLDRDLRTEICCAFAERIKENGYYPMIYASENWIRRNLNSEALQQYDFWAPQYLEENDFLYDFTIWQYTEKGKIPGVKEKADLNISLIDYASFVPDLRDAYLKGAEIISTEDTMTEVVDENGD